VSSHKEQYQAKRMNAHDAVGLVKDNELIVVPTGAGEPPVLLTALSDRRREFHGVKVAQIVPQLNYDYYDPETAENVCHYSYFFGTPSRKGGQQGWIDYMPNYFSEIPIMMRRGLTPVDVVFALASEMDEHGYFAISLGTCYTMEAIKRARVVVLESNPNVPFTYGNCHVHVSQVTAIVEDDRPVREVGLPAIGTVQEAIAKYVADMIPDGATLQIGYGSIPDAVVMQLTNKHDLGIHTEMVGDGIMTLVEAGVITNKRKNYLPNKIVATFALGSKKLYQFMHRNPSLEMHPVDFTNDPFLAGQNDNLIAINGTMQIDFMGQCGSESLGYVPYSGTGGQTDFVRAANRSEGGKAFIVTQSTAKNDTISRIVPVLSPGTHVSTSKNDVNYVVTEYGIAQLRGKSAKQRAQELISVAHPNFRAELTEEARKMNLL